MLGTEAVGLRRGRPTSALATWALTVHLWARSVAAGAVVVAMVALYLHVLYGHLWRLAAPGVALVAAAVAAASARAAWSGFPTVWRRRVEASTLLAAGSAALWLAGGVLRHHTMVDWVSGPAAALAVVAAGLPAYALGSRRHRDLGQSPLLFWHLSVQAVMAGSAALYLLTPALNTHEGGRELLAKAFVTAGTVHLLMVLTGHTGRPDSAYSSRVTRLMTGGRTGRVFWVGAIGGCLSTVALGLAGWDGKGEAATWIAALVAQAALLAYSYAFVSVGQDLASRWRC